MPSTSDEPEEWRPVAGWEGLYEVSSLGRVRSLARPGDLNKGRFQAGRVLKGAIKKTGYVEVRLRHSGKDRCFLAHRLVCTAFHGDRAMPWQVGHQDGSRDNNRASNLYWCTHAENELQKVEHGTDARGENNSRVKISSADVRSIRKTAGVISGADWSRRLGVTQGLISAIRKGRNRKYD